MGEATQRERLAITGISGFIGQKLLADLNGKFEICGVDSSSVLPRSSVSNRVMNVQYVDQFKNIKTVIHLAGIAERSSSITAADYSYANTRLTKELSKRCADDGVENFIFLSSAFVYGNSPNDVICEKCAPNPEDDYSRSKLAAEMELRSLNTDMRCFVIKPPLVYGARSIPFQSIINRIQANKYFPTPTKENKRSFLSIENLCSAVDRLMERTDTFDQGIVDDYIVCDEKCLSTELYIQIISKYLEKDAKQLYFSKGILEASDYLSNLLLGKKFLSPLHDDFCLDNSKICERLSWSPPLSTSECVEKSVMTIRNLHQY